MKLNRLLALVLASHVAAQDVPLSLYKDANFPRGIDMGRSYGVSFGDYDQDGWIDIVVTDAGFVWHNEQGMTWRKARNLGAFLPKAGRRYGMSFGDYNNDGLPDMATEPRDSGGDSCFHLLKNLGGGPNFIDVATDPTLVIGAPCDAQAETFCWGDVDDDGDLDIFLPIYDIGASMGNVFLENLGPTGPGGEYRLMDETASSNLGNPGVNNRAEGAQMVDTDGDGDIDVYSNGTLYVNETTSAPSFVRQSEAVNNIGLRNILDEGAGFADYDMDGDYDLFVSYVPRGLKLWECRGDGTYFGATNKIQDPQLGSDLGMSFADWDNDGDIDVTCQFAFHLNTLIETGTRSFVTASHNIPAAHISAATPAFGDWDKDGDLDCAMGNFGAAARFYANDTYDASTPHEERRHVRVRVVRDSPTVPQGLETEYGANVEITVRGDSSGYRRRNFVASAHGYLNQNEYALHFALPPKTAEPTFFDVVVDFPGRPDRGILRLDGFMNPALSGIELESLVDREIVVFRSGKVILDGIVYPAGTNDFTPRVTMTTGGLVATKNGAPLMRPTPVSGSNSFVGIELDTTGVAGPVVVNELILDGQLADSRSCDGDGPFNVAVWDVTNPLWPVRVAEDAYDTAFRNDRSTFPLEAILLPDRRYRVVAHVESLRATPINGPVAHGNLIVTGGLSFQDHDPCSGLGVSAVDADPNRVYLALRFRTRLPQPPPARPAGLRAR